MKDGQILILYKQCFKCLACKPMSDFYKHKGMYDGHLGKCKECTKTDATANRNANLEKVREYDRQRAKAPKRKRYLRERCIVFRKENPQKYHAHSLVTSAVRCGRLIKPDKCMGCGKKKKLQGHHDDYYKPLEVKWLCAPCHYVEHN